ncbi:MAG TPA: ATP-binding protein [Polyangiaceae bacterium]|nr:ATP-binding protein [Polyangiaceae bacterium]
MKENLPEARSDDEALAWRSDVAQLVTRAFVGIFVTSAAVIGFAMERVPNRGVLIIGTLVAAGALAIPAFTGRPRGAALAWLIVGPSLAMALMGYSRVGVLSGPGVSLMVALMLAGLLLGHRAMIGLTVLAAAVLSVIAWAIVSGHFPAPHPADIDMRRAGTWARSLLVTFFAISLFGGLMVVVVTRMERALLLARQETLRREQAERARAEAELQAVESKQLEMVGRLAAGVAHDFNNNLTAIMGSAELLKLEPSGSDAASELSDSILQASQRLAELTRQLLAYSRKARMQQTPTDLHDVIEQAVSLARRSMDPNITIVTELNAERSTVNGDAALLQSAVLNLLINARDAMPEGGRLTVATVSVELTRSGIKGMPVGPCVVLEVIDTGRGIPEDQVAHIFDPFFTTKPIGKGTGLGLASVAGTVRAHGGNIEVNSDATHGTAFRMYLPCSDPEGSARMPVSTTIVHGEGEILLVDDDPMVSMTAIATLQSFGYRTTLARDGKSALEQVATHPGRFELVLLDLRMPGLSGEATFDKLRDLEPTLPVLIWSGYAAEQDVNAMLKRGAAGFVQKPYRVAELSRIVAAKIRKRSS